MRVWCAAILLVLSASLTLAQPTDKDKQAKDPKGGPNYYPLLAGNAWHYKLTVNGQVNQVKTHVAKIEKIDGVEMARLEISNAPIVEHLVQNDKGVFRTRFNGAEVSPPLQLLPYPVKLGDKWKKTFRVVGENENHAYEGEIANKLETVEVPAGKYLALRVRLKLEVGDQKFDTTYWFVTDVGIVKQQADIAGVAFTLELEKTESKKIEAEPKSK